MNPMAISKLRAWFLMIALLTGCAGRLRPPAPPAAPAPDRSVAWREYELTDEGFYAKLPAEPVERVVVRAEPSRTRQPSRVRVHSLIGGTKALGFGCALSRALDFNGVLNDSLRTSVIPAWFFRGDVKRSAAPPLDGFSGEMVSGEDPDGNARIAVTYQLADGLFMAWVNGRGKALDRDAASRVLTSLRLSSQWQIRAAPMLGLAVAVPSFAAERPTAQGMDYAIGGNDNVDYSVAVSGTAPGVSTAAALETVKVPDGYTLLSSSELQHHDLPGKEIFVARGARRVRSRAFAANGRLYWIFVASNTAGKLDDADARRFFDSLRIFQ